MRRKAILTLCLLFTAHLLTAQRQLFTNYSMNEGLVHNAIRTIYQDRKGFIWIGTWEGVSMYDGKKFTNYTTANGLSHAVVNEIFESAEGNICIACNNGSMDQINRNGTIVNIQRTPVINSLQRIGNKTIATTDETGLYELTEGVFVKPPQHGPRRYYFRIAPFNDSLMVAQSDSSIQLLNKRYELFAEWTDRNPIFAESGLMTDSKHRVWIGTTQGLKLLSAEQEKGKPLKLEKLPAAFDIPLLKNNWIIEMLEDDAGNTWFGTPNGLARIGADGSQQVITEKDGLPSSDVTTLFQDREKNIWIGGSRGITRLVTKTNIRIYTTASGLLTDQPSLLLPLRNGNMLVQFLTGLQLYDKAKGSLTTLSTVNQHFSNDDHGNPLSLLTDKKSGTPFLILSSSQDQHIFFSPSSSGAYSAYKDRQGGYFYPSYGGVYFSRDFSNWKKTLFYGDNRALLIDSKENIWIGSLDSGIYRIRYEYINDTPQVVKQERFLPGVGIRSIYEDSKGYIWAGSRYHGLYRIDPTNPQSGILHFDQSSGLTSNRITSIAEDRNGAMWIDFYHGLDKLVPSGTTFRIFNFSRFNNFFTNINAMAFDKDHLLWLATSQGLVSISDGAIENTKALPAYIMTASLGDSIYRNQEKDTRVVLDYRHKQVQFEFASPGFINEKQLQFSYRLLGSNNAEWSEASTQNSVSYANLQPGSYRFEVRNKGWNGEWGEPDYFLFTIRPPFWRTAWFIVPLILSIIAMVYWLLKRRIKAIRKQSSLQQKIAETEMIALRAQMNPHFIFNCLNAIDNMIQTNQKDKATIYLSRFAKLVRNVLDSSKHNTVPFHKDYESLQLYLQMEQFRCSNKFEYELNVDDELLHGDFHVPPLIVQPFVENAIHHGLLNKESGERKLVISVRPGNDHIQYTITDNGIGRTKAALLKQINKPEHKSYGIQITGERIHLYNGKKSSADDLTITDLYENGEPCGTMVVIRLKTDNVD
jgi:ligand-binding sensor domain-containing protein